MGPLSLYLRSCIKADIIEEVPMGNGKSITYIGVFRPLTSEHDEGNCMIQCFETTTGAHGYAMTRMKYAGGINFDFRYTWNDRAELDYQYSRTKA